MRRLRQSAPPADRGTPAGRQTEPRRPAGTRPRRRRWPRSRPGPASNRRLSGRCAVEVAAVGTGRGSGPREETNALGPEFGTCRRGGDKGAPPGNVSAEPRLQSSGGQSCGAELLAKAAFFFFFLTEQLG